MACPRCGAVFEGNFCPQCGLPAAASAAAGPPAYPVACPRCGATFQGNFCPRCGLRAGAPAYAQPPYVQGPSSGTRSVLSILWILAIVGVLVLVAVDVTALLISPTHVWPGIEGVSEGRTTNPGLDAGSANWTFLDPTLSGSTGTYAASGGDPGGYLQMSLPTGANVGGAWEQAFQVTGSAPFVALVRLDFQVQSSGSGPRDGRLVVSIERVPAGVQVAGASAVLHYNGTMTWQTSPEIDVSDAITDPGTYYLKVAFLAASNPSATLVGFDNLQLAWATNAYFWVAAPLPIPIAMYFSRDPAQMDAAYLFVVAVVLFCVGYYVYRDRRLLPRAFTAPLDAIGLRLRSMSTWVAVAQAWLAVTFFQYAVIFLLALVGVPATTPINETAVNAWFLLYDLARASVFEELAFRMLLLGVPMVAISLLVRPARPAAGSPPSTAPRMRGAVMDSLRHLLGGQLRADSPRQELLAAWILLFVSSAVFGMAHVVGWGDWKVVPAAVFGLACGYLFLRHGIGAAILAHFLNDYLGAILLENVGGQAMEAVLSLLLVGLIIAGAGFFAWYVRYAWQHFQDLLRRYGARIVRQPTAVASRPASPPLSAGYAAPPPGAAGPAYPYAPPPPPPSTAQAPPPPSWSPPPGAALPMRGGAQLPQGYAPTYHPPPYGYPPVRFQCPYCGWVEAHYENRVFTCLRCGRAA